MKWKKGYKYQLTSTSDFQTTFRPKEDINHEFIRLTKNGVLTLYKGYACDGPTWPAIDTLSFMRGSFVHDALAQLMRAKLLDHRDWRRADHNLEHYVMADGMWWLRTKWVMAALKLTNGSYALPKNKRKIYSI